MCLILSPHREALRSISFSKRRITGKRLYFIELFVQKQNY